MSRPFLVGSFLPAHASAFGRMDRKPAEPVFNQENLGPKLAARGTVRLQRRAAYRTSVLYGLLMALSLAVFVFTIRLEPDAETPFSLVDQELVQMEEILQTVQVVKPPPPPRPPMPVEVPDDDVLADEEDLDLDALFNADEAMASLPPPPPPAVEEAPEPEVFTVVEQMPTMVGGYGALMASLDYPEVARRAGLDGVVVVQVTVDESGMPADAVVVKGVHESLDKEAVRAVLEQSFEPGMQRSRAVKVRTNISVRFRLVS